MTMIAMMFLLSMMLMTVTMIGTPTMMMTMMVMMMVKKKMMMYVSFAFGSGRLVACDVIAFSPGSGWRRLSVCAAIFACGCSFFCEVCLKASPVAIASRIVDHPAFDIFFALAVIANSATCVSKRSDEHVRDPTLQMMSDLSSKSPALVVVCSLLPLLLVVIRGSTTSVLEASVVVEVSAFIATVCTSVAVQALVQSRVERNLQYGKMAADFNASSSLLQLICDSILELDADLQIAEHSCTRCYAAAGQARYNPVWTSRTQSPGAAEAGRAVELPRKFEDHPPNSLKAQAFHTHLVDSDANRFRTEVFQVTYHTLQGHARHLIGLRDVTDQGSICGSKAAESFSIVPRSYTPMSAAT
eukprot:s2341_g6.t1